MDAALALAERGWGRVAPNPLVGAVVVRDGEIVGRGWHPEFGEPHAEVFALGEANERARGATLYVTLEPCAHVGKTPPCTDAILAAGIARVVIATEDPNPVAAGGATRLRAAGVDVTIGVRRQAARDLNAIFLHAFSSTRPFVTLKLALSADGGIAPADRRPIWLTSEASRREVHRLRAAHDATAVGAETVRTDDPALTVREGFTPRVTPRRVVFSRSGEIPLDARLVRSARESEVVLAILGNAPAHRDLEALGVRVVRADTLAGLTERLAGLGIRSILLEGGAELAASFLDAALVDRLVIFASPITLGEGRLEPFAGVRPERRLGLERWRLIERRESGSDVMSVYAAE